MRKSVKLAIITLSFLLLCTVTASGGPRVWKGLDLDFTKEADSDWTSAANQDRITDSVWITRGDKKGIFNIAKERGYKPSPPAGTEWAYGKASDWESLRFHSWETWNSRIPPDIVDQDAVLHLLAADVYLDITFLSWTEGDSGGDGGGGGFSYERATEGSAGEKVWTGATITFTKDDFADWTDAANQDRITDDVWITRADREGIFNIAKERGYRLNPPSGTEWAYGSATDWATLDFMPLHKLNAGVPADMVDQDAVLHLLDEDVYVDVKFKSWTPDHEGGGFSYERATEGVPGEKVWSGAVTTFTKADDTDWTAPANQDRITNTVWITRADREGIFNIVGEPGFREHPPMGTEWAFGSAENRETLTFGSWDDLTRREPSKERGDPASLIDQALVVHLLEDDIYLDIMFTGWSEDDTGGGFSYSRAANSLVEIVAGPTATPPNVPLAGDTVAFSVEATDGDDDPLTYEWDFGDGTTGSGTDPTHQYGATGEYTATVVVSDGTMSVQGSVDVKVNSAPTIETGPTAAPDLVMIGDEVAFDATASDLNGDPLSFSWDFGDGANSAGSSTTHTYDTAGRYTASLTVTDGLDETLGTVDLVAANPLAIAKIKGKLNFKKADKDSLLIKGDLELPTGFQTLGEVLRIDVGGVEEAFNLDEKGKAKTGAGTAKLKFKKKTGLWSFKVKLKNGSFADQWADDGLVNETVKAAPIVVMALIEVGGITSFADANVSYTGKEGKSGKFK